MKTKDRQIGWHLFLVVVVFLLPMPIVFAISNSFKTMQEAFNTVFQVIPLHPTLENYRHVFDKLPFVKITLNTFLIASTVTILRQSRDFWRRMRSSISGLREKDFVFYYVKHAVHPVYGHDDSKLSSDL